MKKCYLPTVYEPDGSNAHFKTKILFKKGGMEWQNLPPTAKMNIRSQLTLLMYTFKIF